MIVRLVHLLAVQTVISAGNHIRAGVKNLANLLRQDSLPLLRVLTVHDAEVRFGRAKKPGEKPLQGVYSGFAENISGEHDAKRAARFILRHRSLGIHAKPSP